MSAALHRDYEIPGGEEDVIGRGRFGTVRRCFSRSNTAVYAVKSTDKSLLLDDLDFDGAVNEPKLTLLASDGGADSNVVKLHAAYEDDDYIHLVLDLSTAGDLFSLLSAEAPLPEPRAAALTSQIATALAAIHRRGVAHRDLKPDNILLFCNNEGDDGEDELVLKLTDFGSAAEFEAGDGRRVPMRGVVGTPHYVAPDVVAGRDYGEKVDIWSLGVIVYMMLAGAPPFDGETAGEVFDAVLRANLRFPPRIFGGVSHEAKDLLRKMLCKDPSRRLSAEQVLSHPWIRSRGGDKELIV